MLLLVLIGVYLVFKVTTRHIIKHKNNGYSIVKNVIKHELRELYENLLNTIISSQRDKKRSTHLSRKASFYKGYRRCGMLSYALEITPCATRLQQKYQ